MTSGMTDTNAAQFWHKKAREARVEVDELRQTLKLQQASYEREREIDQAEIERLRAELETLKGLA